MPTSDWCCGLQMPCENLTFCQQQDLLQDPTVMAWMRINPPHSLPLHSVARAEVTEQLAAQESHVDMLNARLDDARRQVEAAYKVVVETLTQIKNTRLLVTKSRAILAPIRILPNEILSYILALVDPSEIPSRLKNITNLCSISKRWNQAARATPEIWTNWDLALSYDHMEESIFGAKMTTPERMENFLLRSMPRSLDLRVLSTYRYCLIGVAKAPRTFLDAIFPRCRKLHYRCKVFHGPCCCPQILAQLSVASSLGELSWESCKPERWGSFEQQGLGQTGPIHLERLRSLQIEENTKIISCLHIPNLTDLILVQISLSTEDLTGLATSFLNLLVLRCHSIRYHRDSAEASTPIRFKMLRDFHLTNGSESSEFGFPLAGTVMHDSTTLCYILRKIIRLSDFGGTRNFLPGMSISQLDLILDADLQLFTRDSTATEVADWFAMTPNLKTLVLAWKLRDDCNTDNQNNLLAARILQSMSISKSRGPCRRLKYLRCHQAAGGEVSAPFSSTRVFLTSLENFAYFRSAKRAASNRTRRCFISLYWHHRQESSLLQRLVKVDWEEVKGLLDLMTDEEVFSDDGVTEASESVPRLERTSISIGPRSWYPQTPESDVDDDGEEEEEEAREDSGE